MTAARRALGLVGAVVYLAGTALVVYLIVQAALAIT